MRYDYNDDFYDENKVYSPSQDLSEPYDDDDDDLGADFYSLTKFR